MKGSRTEPGTNIPVVNSSPLYFDSFQLQWSMMLTEHLLSTVVNTTYVFPLSSTSSRYRSKLPLAATCRSALSLPATNFLASDWVSRTVFVHVLFFTAKFLVTRICGNGLSTHSTVMFFS